MRLHKWWVGMLGVWAVLAIASGISYPRIFFGNCYFESSWLVCAAQLSSGAKFGLFAVIALMVVVFGVGGWQIWDTLQQKTPVPKTVLFITIGMLALAFLVVPFASTDTSYYFYAGKAAHSGLNPFVQVWPMEKPYLYPPSALSITSFSYGPIMLRYFRLLYRMSGGQLSWFLVWWKLTLTLALIAGGWLFRQLSKQFTLTASPAAFWVLWLAQPLFLFEILVNGHFDIVWLLTVFVALLAALKGRWWLVILALSVGIWIKFLPLLFAPFFALWWWQETNGTTWRRNLCHAVLGLGLAAGATIFSWGSFWQGPAVFSSLIIQSKWAVISWFAVIYHSLEPLFIFLFHDHAHIYLTSLTHGVLAVVAVLFLWPYIKKFLAIFFKRLVWQPIEYVQAMFVCLLVYLFVWQKSLWPWYSVWLIPIGLLLAMSSHHILVKKIVRWIGTVPFVFYPVWLANWWVRGTDAGGELWFYIVMTLLVTVYPLRLLWAWRKQAYGSQT